MTAESVLLARGSLGRFGVWLAPIPVLSATPSSVLREQVARIEALGYGSVWVGESAGRGADAVALLGVLLAATRRLVIGTGVVPIAARPAATLQAAAATLAEAYPARLILGLGVGAVEAQNPDSETSSPPGLVAGLRAYLDGMDQAAEFCPQPSAPFPRVLSALGPNMLALARDHADGAHPYSVTVEHAVAARAILGPDKLLIPEQAVILEPDPAVARATGRAYLAAGSAHSPYRRNLRRLGYGAAEFVGGGTDRLVDARFAWGEEAAVARRLGEHLDNGADSVLVHPVAADVTSAVDQLERLAPALTIGTQ